MKTHLYSFLFLFCSFSFFEAKAQSQCDYFYLNIVNPTFTTQAEVDAFADQYGHCPNIVIYSLTIGFEEGSEESDITDLSRLANISHVYGNLIIRKNPNLTTLHGLHNISSNSFAGSLRIDNNATLADISALSKITQARYLNIRNNNVLQNLNGLQNITQITGAGSGSGYLYIRSNPQLTNIDALQNLTTVGNYIEIMDNALLPNLNGLSGITSINGNIRIYENAALKSIIGLRNISASGIKALIIENNPELEVCNLANFCTYLANPAATHPRSISQNKTTCLNTNAVTTACATACTAISGTNVVLYSQADIVAFGSVYGLCTNITVNNLTIGYASGGDDSDITDLTPLENIKTITGNLILRRNPNLTTLNGLHNITSFSGDLRIEKCLGLTNITALSGITQARYLNIRDNDQLTNLNGLQNLTQITGSGSGSGYLYIYNNARLNNIDALQNLTFIGNYIEIKINSMLLNLNGLSAITTIGGHLDISTNTALTNLNGLSGVTSINGNITIHDNAALTDISGLKNIPDSSISALTITQNPNLEVCNLPNFCEYLSDLDNTREISGNAPGCEDEADVMDACSNCPTPTNITATDITMDSAVINWTSQGTLFDMEWGVSGFTQGTGEQQSGITETSYILSNLYDGTSYDVYIRQDCDEEQSNWRLYTFSSLSYYCMPTPTVPNSENRGDYIDSFTTTGGANNISNINSGYSPNGYGNFAATHSASQYQGDELTFSVVPGDESFSRGLRIWVDWGKDGVFDYDDIVYTAPALFRETHNGSFEIPDVPAGDYRMRVFLRFNTLDPNPCNLGTLNNFGEVEDYTLTVLTAPCLAPTGITATNITADSAVINWTSQGELFDMEWGVSGFTQGTGTSVNGITETSYMLSNLYDITSYDVYIRQDCDEEQSNWRLYTFSSLSYYCVPTPTNPISERDGSYIDSFTTTGGVTNISNINSGYSPNGYGNFAATHSASQYPGGEIAFSAEKIEGGANYPRGLRIWVDWNKNGVFDASEIVYQAPVLLNGTHNGTFEIPDVPAGDYRMRVFLRYNTLEPNPCNLGTLNNFGEVEDYTLTVLPDLSGNCDSFTIWNGDEWSNGTPDATKKAIIEGNLNITEDMEACELLLNSGILTVVSENALTVHGAIVNTQEAENFVVESGASLIQIDDAENTGAITVRRNSTPMYRLDTTLWSSPVEGQNLFDFSPGTLTNRFYYYDAVNNIFDHAGLNEDSVFKAATGYGIRSPNNYPASDSGNPAREFEGEFTGVPHNGNYEVDTFLWSEQPYGYNLVGNPYPSALDATMFTAANADVGILYFWTHLSRPLADGTYPKGNYATWTPEGGGVAAAADEDENFVPNEDLQIQPGQGFFVRTIAAGTVIFNNTMRTNGTGQFYFTQPERHRFWLNLESEHNTHNQILIGYVENATLGFDHRIDANIMNYNGNALSSVIEDASTGSATQRLVIQGRPLPFTDTDVVPLGFKAVHSGHFTISIEKVDGLFEEGQKIYIKDGRYGTLHDLTEGGYNFYSPPGEHNERFEIVYATEGEMGIEDIIYNNILIYGYDFTVYIHSQVESIDKVEIYDLLGRKLYQRRLSGAETEARSIEIPTEAFGNQLLLVRAYTQDGKTVVKRVVNR